MIGLLLTMIVDLLWLIQGHLSQLEMSPMFFQANARNFFYFGVPQKLGWSFFVRHDPRGRPVKYNVIEEVDIEEAQEEVNDYQEWQLPSDEDEEDGDDFAHAKNNGDNDDDDVDDDHDHGDEDGDEDDDDGNEDVGGDNNDQSDKYDDGDDDDDDMDEDDD